MVNQVTKNIILRMREIPHNFVTNLNSRCRQVRGDNPEDNINLVRPIIFISSVDGYQLKFITKRSRDVNINWEQLLPPPFGKKDTALLDMIVDTTHIMKINDENKNI